MPREVQCLIAAIAPASTFFRPFGQTSGAANISHERTEVMTQRDFEAPGTIEALLRAIYNDAIDDALKALKTAQYDPASYTRGRAAIERLRK